MGTASRCLQTSVRERDFDQTTTQIYFKVYGKAATNYVHTSKIVPPTLRVTRRWPAGDSELADVVPPSSLKIQILRY